MQVNKLIKTQTKILVLLFKMNHTTVIIRTICHQFL